MHPITVLFFWAPPSRFPRWSPTCRDPAITARMVLLAWLPFPFVPPSATPSSPPRFATTTHAVASSRTFDPPGEIHSALYAPCEMRPSLLFAFVAVLLIVCCARSAHATDPGYGRSFASFDELRNTRPAAAGEVVYLVSHIAGMYKGGGQFVGALSAGTNDYGMVASNGGTYRWNRIVPDYEQLNVLHFGATHDGVTDDHDAVMRMINWSFSTGSGTGTFRNGVRFVEGSIFISPIDITATDRGDFALFGPTAPSARGPTTTIVSDGSLKPVFNVSTRRVTIRGISWDGRATATIDANYVPSAISNFQPFFQNIEVAGEFVNVESFYATRTGGVVFYLLDTLDTKFYDIETYNTYSNLWNISWSNTAYASWDHSTAVEGYNMFITNSYGNRMLNITRSGQGVLRNVFIKHCRNPGSFENSQFVIDNLYIEDCKEPLNFLNNRDVSNGITLVNASINRGYSPNPWNGISGYDLGWIQASNFGAFLQGPFAKLWKASMVRGSNDDYYPLWVKIGTFKNPTKGGVWKIEALSRPNYVENANYTRPTANGSGGRTNIMLQTGNDSAPIVTFSTSGYGAILDVSYTDVTATSVALWAKVAPYCGEYSFFIKGTGKLRAYTTTTDQSMFLPSGKTQADTPTNSSSASRKASMHNGSAGLGAERGILTVDTKTQLTAGSVAGHFVTKVNGVNIATPYYHLTPSIASSPADSTTVVSGNKLTLSVEAKYSVSYQWQYTTSDDDQDEFLDIAGATDATYSVHQATAYHGGKYRVLAIGSEGRSTAAVSKTTVVSVA